jgi:hypothetical protein
MGTEKVSAPRREHDERRDVRLGQFAVIAQQARDSPNRNLMCHQSHTYQVSTRPGRNQNSRRIAFVSCLLSDVNKNSQAAESRTTCSHQNRPLAKPTSRKLLATGCARYRKSLWRIKIALMPKRCICQCAGFPLSNRPKGRRNHAAIRGIINQHQSRNVR